MSAPYVSVVIVGRNDDYGDDFLGRINTFVRSLDHQVANYTGMFELVIVEWNPLPDYDALSEAIVPTHNLPVRFVTVPADVHETIGARHPVLEFHGKNVGIRRSRGQFVLVTNPDILFSQAIIDEIATQRLRTDTVYRTDRCDFTIEGIKDIDSADLIDFAVRNTFVVHAMNNRSSVSVRVAPGIDDIQALPRSDIAADAWHTNGCGDFMLASREAFFTVRGLYETLEHRWHVDSISLLRFATAKMKQQVLVSPLTIFHQHHDRKDQDVSIGSLNLMQLSQQAGSTDWGFQNVTLPETQRSPG